MNETLRYLASQTERELATASLSAFAQRLIPGWRIARHLDYLCKLLERLESGDGPQRLIVSLPPRHGKSTLISVAFPAWCLGRQPRREVILASHSASLAEGFGRKAKQLIEDPLYPFNTKLSADSTSVAKFNLLEGGGMTSLGVGGGVTGKGADLLLIDDPVNDALSQVELDRAYDWFQNIAFPRLNANGKVLIVSARLSLSDLPGRILDGDDAGSYEYIELPAICSDPQDDPLGRKAGEALWPEVYGVEELEKRRNAMTSAAYNSQYLQLPSEGGAEPVFKCEWFPTYSVLPRPKELPFDPVEHQYISPLNAARANDAANWVTVTALDAAGKLTEAGSWSALVTLLSDGENIYVCEVERKRIDYEGLKWMCVKHCKRWNSDILLVESTGMGSRILGSFEASLMPTKGLDPVKSKLQRALDVAPYCEQGKVHVPERAMWMPIFERELFSFPNSRFNDQVDSFCWALQWVHRVKTYKKNARFMDNQIEALGDWMNR
jgi:phage terminase large subunit-like protein